MSGNPTTRVPCGSNPLSDGGEAAAASTNWRRPSRCLPSSSLARSPVAPHSFPSSLSLSLSVSLRWCEIRCKSVAERKGDKDKAAVRSARLVRFGWSLTSQAHLSRFSSRGARAVALNSFRPEPIHFPTPSAPPQEGHRSLAPSLNTEIFDLQEPNFAGVLIWITKDSILMSNISKFLEL